MDKNPNDEFLTTFDNSINSILCYDAFSKEAIIKKIIEFNSTSIILLDFDQLFTGYINSGILKKENNLQIYSPSKDNWLQIFKEVISQVSTKQTILIIDSLNGFFSIFDEKDSGRYANSCMMMMSSCVRNMQGMIFLCSVAKIKENEGWILQPTGRHVLDTNSISKFFVRKQKDIQIESLSQENKTEKIFHL